MIGAAVEVGTEVEVEVETELKLGRGSILRYKKCIHLGASVPEHFLVELLELMD